jgi:O-antigen/teichoic acid export membrane protein
MFKERFSRWRKDDLLRRVVRNSSYLFSGNAVSAALSFVQLILVVRLLGVEQFGLATAVMLFASNVNRLLSFRMSEVVTKYMGEALTHGNKDRAAALAKWIGAAEAITSLFAYFFLFIIAPWYARDPFATDLYRFYGLYLVANIVYETSTGVLQATDRFNRVGFANLVQGIATASIILIAFIMGRGIFEVLAAHLLGKIMAACVVTGSAIQELKRKTGSGWVNAPLSIITDWKSIVRFAIGTNINGTVNLFARDNIPLYIQSLLGDVALGYFSLASRLINLVTLPIDPFIAPTYAEVTRTIVQRQWQTTRKLLKQVSAIGGIWTLIAGGAVIALGWWFIPFVFGSDMSPAYPCFIVLLIGYGVANILNWNRPLLLALGYPNYPLVVAAVTGTVEIILIFLFVPGGGFLVGAAIFSAYLVVTVGWNVLRGLSIIKHEEATA